MNTVIILLALSPVIFSFYRDMYLLLTDTNTTDIREVIAVVTVFGFFAFFAYFGSDTLSRLLQKETLWPALYANLITYGAFSLGYSFTKNFWRPFRKEKIAPDKRLRIEIFQNYMQYSMMGLLAALVVVFTIIIFIHQPA